MASSQCVQARKYQTNIFALRTCLKFVDETFFRHCACVEGEESNVQRPADNLTPFILVAGVLANKETWTLIKPKAVFV